MIPAIPRTMPPRRRSRAGRSWDNLLYGDYEGGQRMISRFLMRPGREDRWLLSVIHHWNVDRPDPR